MKRNAKRIAVKHNAMKRNRVAGRSVIAAT